jgi:DNA-binding transcriptional LysR family regulator
MDLWHLTVFKNVIDTRGFSSAAKAVHLTQPTVSSHIKEIEAHFNCRLVDRIGKAAVPTKAGELLYSYAGRLLSLYEETEAAMAEFLGSVSGRLTIGGSTIPAGYILPEVIGGFLAGYQDVRIALNSGDTEQILNDILEYRLELGVVGARTERRRIAQTTLIRDDMRLIVPGDHKWSRQKNIEPDQLIAEPFIIRESGSGTLQSIQNSLAKIGRTAVDLNIVAEFGSTASVIQGIKNRVGVSILSPIAVSGELKTGHLRALEVKGLDLTRHFYLTTHRDRTPSPLCAAFIRFLKERFAASGGGTSPPGAGSG